MGKLDLHRWTVSTWLVVCAILPTLVALCFGTPPLWVSDEPAHFMRADSIARGAFGPQLGHEASGRLAAGGNVDTSYSTFLAVLLPRDGVHTFRPTSIASVRSVAHLPQADAVAFGSFSNTAIYPPPLYLPAIVTIAASRLLRLSLLAAFYAARLANVLVFTFLVWFATRRSVDGGSYAACCAAIPILLFNTASLNADALLLPTAICFAVLLAGLPSGRPDDRPLALGAATIVLAAGKVAYMPLAILPPAIAWLEDRRASRRVLLLAGATVLAITLWLFWACMVRGKVVSIRSDVLVDPDAQVWWVVRHPRWFSYIFARTMMGCSPDVLPRMFGYRLGWDNVSAPNWLGIVSATALLGSAVLMPRRRCRPASAGIVWLVALSCIPVIALLLYLQFNAVGASYILGMQGRYFLPLLIVAAPWLPRLRRPPALLQIALPLAAVLTTSSYMLYQIPRWWVA